MRHHCIPVLSRLIYSYLMVYTHEEYPHPIKIPILLIMVPKYKEHGSYFHNRNTSR
jgi:hypothetical protein